MRNRKVWLEPKFCGSNIIKINKWLFQVFYFKMIFESTVNLLACYLIFKSLYNTFSLSLSLFFVTANNKFYNCCWVALFSKVFFFCLSINFALCQLDFRGHYIQKEFTFKIKYCTSAAAIFISLCFSVSLSQFHLNFSHCRLCVPSSSNAAFCHLFANGA